jgi:hypothetical protein
MRNLVATHALGFAGAFLVVSVICLVCFLFDSRQFGELGILAVVAISLASAVGAMLVSMVFQLYYRWRRRRGDAPTWRPIAIVSAGYIGLLVLFMGFVLMVARLTGRPESIDAVVENTLTLDWEFIKLILGVLAVTAVFAVYWLSLRRRLRPMTRLLPRLMAVMSKPGEPTYDGALPAWHPQRLSNRTKASLMLLISVAGIVLLDIIGPMLLSSGQGVISGRLHDLLAVLAVLSVPLMLALLAIGFVLGMTEWYSARKALRPLSRITITATVLHLVLLLLGTILVLAAFALLVGPRSSIPGL